uniref:Secreted protein n=1 Tax=Aegilops tauschii subsp. strangulata TaxID=200361 RepID=A0A453RPD3_AEGTS
MHLVALTWCLPSIEHLVGAKCCTCSADELRHVCSIHGSCMSYPRALAHGRYKTSTIVDLTSSGEAEHLLSKFLVDEQPQRNQHQSRDFTVLIWISVPTFTLNE